LIYFRFIGVGVGFLMVWTLDPFPPTIETLQERSIFSDAQGKDSPQLRRSVRQVRLRKQF
jgi:hypothetical protein